MQGQPKPEPAPQRQPYVAFALVTAIVLLVQTILIAALFGTKMGLLTTFGMAAAWLVAAALPFVIRYLNSRNKEGP